MNPVDFIATLSSADALNILQPLLLFIAGMVAYGIFIFHFYRFLSRRELFRLDLQQYSRSKHPGVRKFFRVILYFTEYLILFPLFIFFWFGVIAVLLAFMSREEDIARLLLIAMALVAAVRITAYYKEQLSVDLAKMLPFALLGVLLVDISYFNFDTSMTRILAFPNEGVLIAYYLFFTIALEWTLRIFNLFVRGFNSNSTEED